MYAAKNIDDTSDMSGPCVFCAPAPAPAPSNPADGVPWFGYVWKISVVAIALVALVLVFKVYRMYLKGNLIPRRLDANHVGMTLASARERYGDTPGAVVGSDESYVFRAADGTGGFQMQRTNVPELETARQESLVVVVATRVDDPEQPTPLPNTQSHNGEPIISISIETPAIENVSTETPKKKNHFVSAFSSFRSTSSPPRNNEPTVEEV